MKDDTAQSGMFLNGSLCCRLSKGEGTSDLAFAVKLPRKLSFSSARVVVSLGRRMVFLNVANNFIKISHRNMLQKLPEVSAYLNILVSDY